MSLTLLVCPYCKQTLVSQLLTDKTVLFCSECNQLTPVINGFPLFNESGTGNDDFTKRMQILQDKFDDYTSYDNYRQSKNNRNALEIYAAFQPFNESSRAIYPFIDTLQSHLQPDQLIIDAWARTGWSAILLAALFPQQQVVAIWEKDNSVLGYAGYGYWLASNRRPPNLSILFLDPDQDLPFGDHSAALIHGHDVVHRRPMKRYLEDLIRVSASTGTILLPHIHLSNSEPEPYFRRGGELRHGREYREFLCSALKNDNRSARVLSEPALFEQTRPVSLIDGAESVDYNAMIVIASQCYYQNPLTEKWLNQLDGSTRAIVNPLLLVCPFTQEFLLNEEGLQDQLSYLLTRHPVYDARLKKILPKKLDTLQIQILLLCDQAKKLEDIVTELGVPLKQLEQILLSLSEYELITLLPVPALAIELQDFHTNHHRIMGKSFIAAWQRVLTQQPDFELMSFEGAPLTVTELAILVDGWRRYLQLRGSIQALRIAEKNELIIPLVMASWLENIVVSTLSESDNISLLIMNDRGDNIIQDISLIEESDNYYWTLLEPFLHETLLPIPANEIKVAKVDDLGWQYWYLNTL